MLELNLEILGYRFEIQRTQCGTIELWCYQIGESNVSSTMLELNAWQLYQFCEFKHNSNLYELCNQEIQSIFIDLIIKNKYELRQLPREWFYKPTLKA